MKHHIPNLLLMLFLLTCLLGSTSQAGASLLVVNGGAPGMINFQGQVSVSGHPFSGSGSFKFAIIDPPGNTSFWSNDNTSSAGSQPTHAMALPVANGLFDVRLGDAGLGMPPVTAAVFADPARLLRVWFSPDGATFTQLAPDTPIVSVPYALQSQFAMDSASLNGHPAVDFMTASQYLGRHWGTLVDTTGDVGPYTSIATGVDGLGLISYYNNDNEDLKVLHCGNLACDSDNTLTTVDSTFGVGTYSSIAIGSDGFGLVSYYDGINGDLKVYHCSHLLCTSGKATSVDTSGDEGAVTAITIGVDGLGLVAYLEHQATKFVLKVLHCGDLACDNLTPNKITYVDAVFPAGEYSLGISIGSDGLGVISYWDALSYNLNVLHCGSTDCDTGDSITAVDTTDNVGGYSSITIGSDGLPLVSYYDDTHKTLKVVHCGNLYCSNSNTITTVDASAVVGLENSITIGPDGLGLVSYLDVTHSALKLMHCGNLLCNAHNTIAIVDSNNQVGGYSSITIVADGQALISNYDHTGGDLKVIKMSGLGRR